MSILQPNMVRGTPKWGQHTHLSLTEYGYSAIVYFKDKVGSEEDLYDDWMLELMHNINEEMIRDQGDLFFSIVWSWDLDQRMAERAVPLSELLQV